MDVIDWHGKLIKLRLLFVSDLVCSVTVLLHDRLQCHKVAIYLLRLLSDN